MVVPRAVQLKLAAGSHHAHGCTVCSRRYSDACQTPRVNGTCQEHRTVPHERPLWETNYDPQDCCRNQTRQCDAATRNSHRLGGPGPWWKCTTCARTHPYRPQSGA